MKNNFLYLILLLLYSCQANKAELPYFNTADFTPIWNATKQPVHTIADFNFLNQNGKEITNNDFENKIYITDFFFTTCPGICPEMTSNMKRLQSTFKDNYEVLLLSHTVTPWIDSVSVLKEYSILKEVNDEKWHLVTGPEEDIYELARKSYFAEKEIGTQKGKDDFLHTENFILVDKKRRIRGIYNGTKLNDIDRLIEDVEILLN